MARDKLLRNMLSKEQKYTKRGPRELPRAPKIKVRAYFDLGRIRNHKRMPEVARKVARTSNPGHKAGAEMFLSVLYHVLVLCVSCMYVFVSRLFHEIVLVY